MTEKDLQIFCGPDDRAAIAHPWSEGEFTYATTGKILVRVPRLPEVKESLLAPQGMDKSIFEPIFSKALKLEAPSEFLRKQVAALSNDTLCDQCKGTGRCSCRSCQADHDCGVCKGEGALPAKAKFFEKIFDITTLKAVLALPELVWDVKTEPTKAAFKFKDGIGILAVKTEED